MHKYRTHTCGELNSNHVNKIIKLSGWINRKRDHGGLIFIDLRDHYGITQCVVKANFPNFKEIELLSHESVITVLGMVILRENELINAKIYTGQIEILVQEISIISYAKELPLPISENSTDYPEETRLTYRFLDLRREEMHQNIILRSNVISFIRKIMIEKYKFHEFQTPILTSSSPEGARDFLVPSRLNPGKFYALPQAPQQFKQLIMLSGFDRYFQIAPCFRDEDARSDRSPGEFYQLDIEMSFITQEDILQVTEELIKDIFNKFSLTQIDNNSFPRITYYDALMKYGTDKPDLRNPLIIQEVSEAFVNSNFKIFTDAINQGKIVKAIKIPNGSRQSNSFFNKMNDWAKSKKMSGLGYMIFSNDQAHGPIAKNLETININKIKEICKINDNDAVFFICDDSKSAVNFACKTRIKLCKELNLLSNGFKFCWIIDMPMYEYDDENNKIIFSHNPFSMPQGGIEALNNQNPLEILAYQYDIVCNGIELSSGAIRNHDQDTMIKAFEIAGYNKIDIEKQFSCLFNAFAYGSPPHGGIAPGIDRIIMLLANTENIREVIMFPMNQRGQDLLMNAPSKVSHKQLKELNINTLNNH